MGSFINIKVGSQNCRGLNDESKRKSLFESFENSGLTILLLQETKLDPTQHLKIYKEWTKGPIFLNSVFGKRAGTAVLFNTCHVKVLNDCYDNDGRVISLDFEILGDRFHLVNFYAPNNSNEKFRFIQNSYKYIMSNFPTILGGDFNLTSDNKIDRYPPKSANDAHSGIFKTVIETFNLEDTCRFVYPTNLFFTFKTKNGGDIIMSRIDKIFAAKHFKIVSYNQSDCEFSDHELVSTHLQYQGKMVFGQRPWRNNTKFYKTGDFLEKFQERWEQLKVKKRALYYGNINKWWLEAKYDIKRMLMSYSKTANIFERREINMMRNTLDTLLKIMTDHPENKTCVKQYFDYKNKLSSKQLKLSKEKILKENADKYFFGDRPTKKFFEVFKRKTDPGSKIIFELKNEHGVTKYNTSEILEIGRLYYQNLFSEKVMADNEGVENDFLENISEVPEEFLAMLQAPITMEELEDAIKSFITGKTPGPDGLSIEFYIAVFSVIKHELLKVLNNFFNSGCIPAKFKVGLIILILKKLPLDIIDNYRPINLLNVDLKIYSKILCTRMKPVLSYVLHETQYCQPGKNIGQLLTTLRDLHFDMTLSEQDSFFISIDFMKAFDNVNHKYIEKVLTKMKFPIKFVRAFMSMYKNATSKLMINGMCSKKIQIKSGLRQGDPMSQDMFSVGANPLWEKLNRSNDIEKYMTLSNQTFLSLAYVDDGNLVLRRLTSLLNALHKIELFRSVSGFTLNMTKTEGIFYDKENFVNRRALPNIKWVDNVEVLGINFGSGEWVKQQWNSKLLEFKKEIGFFKTKSPTLDAKAMLSKFKLCSIFSYISQVYHMPPSLENKINESLVSFVVPHKHTFMTALDFSLPRQYGGYNVSNVVLHINLCLIKPIMLYMQGRIIDNALSKHMYFVEYYLGQQLSSYFKLSQNNCTPHRFEPNECYAKMYEIIVKYKITAEELVEGKIGMIYHRILTEIGENRNSKAKYYRMHKKIFPSYLKTFNYRVCFDLLPVKNKFYQFSLDSEVRITCPFCNINMESAFHIFAKCSKLFKLWEVLDETTRVCFGGICTYSFKRDRFKMCNFSFVESKIQKSHENIILYINSIVNHNIWKMRNKIFHENEIFDLENLINKISASCRARKNFENVEERLTSCKKVEFLNEYCVSLSSIKDAMFDPG